MLDMKAFDSSYAKSINLNLDFNTQEVTPYVVRLPLHTSLKKGVIYICRKIREYLDGE